MLAEVVKQNGEYIAKLKHDHWITKIILHISENEEFKSFVMEDCISSNKNFFDINGVEYKKFNNIIVLDGKEIRVLSSDNISTGKIYLSSESYQSISLRRSITPSSLAYDYYIDIKKDGIKINYRNKRYTLKILAFLILREIGILPSETQVESLYSTLQDVIQSDFNHLTLEIVKFSRYVFPHKVELSFELNLDNTKNYYLLTHTRRGWRIKSINTNKGAVNTIHKLTLNSYYWLQEQTERYSWIRSVKVFLSKLLNIKPIRVILTFSLLLLSIYLILNYSIFMTTFIIIIMIIIVRRIMLYINFKGSLV